MVISLIFSKLEVPNYKIHIMITESKVTEIFVLPMIFCKKFEEEMAKKVIPSFTSRPRRRRNRMMSDAGVITILICFHFNIYRTFKHYYLSCICGEWKHLFPKKILI